MLTGAAGVAKLEAQTPLGEMSEEQLKAFLEAVKADAGLQEQLKAASDADAVVAIAKSAGFVISAEELARAQAEISEEGLSWEELMQVAGGIANPTIGFSAGAAGGVSFTPAQGTPLKKTAPKPALGDEDYVP